MQPTSHFSKPIILLCFFLLIVQIANSFYLARGVEPSPAFDLLYALGFLWLIGWWLKEDSRRYGVKWVYDMGLFLYLAWPFVIPYYLFKTRGVKALITILSFAGIFMATYMIGALVYALLAE